MIRVSDDYFVDVDSNCYTVYKRVIAKSGKNVGQENYINASYHASMKSALENIINRIQKEDLQKDRIIPLQEAIEILVNVKKEFIDLISEVETYEK